MSAVQSGEKTALISTGLSMAVIAFCLGFGLAELRLQQNPATSWTVVSILFSVTLCLLAFGFVWRVRKLP